MIQNFTHCYKIGSNAEKRFANKHLTNIIWPTKSQDMFEHWDVSGIFNNEQYKFDVKTTNRLSYSTPDNLMDSAWVEGTNVNGHKGWVKGNADYIVFEREETWLIVDRKELLNLTMKKLQNNNFIKGKGVYLLHTRTGRKDKVTKVLFNDMKEFCKTYELSK